MRITTLRLQRLLLAIAALPAMAEADAERALMRKAVDGYFANARHFEEYSFERRTVRTQYEQDGRVKSREVWTSRVDWFDGLRMSWTVGRDDKPLDPKEKAEIEESLRKRAAEWRQKTPEQQRKLLEENRARQRKEMEYLREFPEALDFRRLPDETVEGRAALVYSFSPRPGYKPASMQGSIYRKVRGRIWIDRDEGHFIRLEGEVFDDVSIGGLLAKIGKGTRFHIAQARLDNGVWLPSRQLIRVDARVMLVKNLHREMESTYSGWRRPATVARAAE